MTEETELEMFLEPMLFLFRVLALSHLRSSKFPQAKRIPLLNVFFLFHSTLALAALIIIIYQVLKLISDEVETDGQDKSMYYYIDSIGFFGNFLAFFITYIETTLKRREEREIYKLLAETNKCIGRKLNFKIDYRRIHWKYWCKMHGFYLLSIGSAVVSVCIVPPLQLISRQALQGTFLLVALVVIRSRTFQIALLISVMGDFLSYLNAAIKRRWETLRLVQNVDSIEDDLFNFREVYSNCWLMKQSISHCFGWSLIAIVLQDIVDIIIGIYWVFMNLDSVDSPMLTYCELSTD